MTKAVVDLLIAIGVPEGPVDARTGKNRSISAILATSFCSGVISRCKLRVESDAGYETRLRSSAKGDLHIPSYTTDGIGKRFSNGTGD